MPIRPTTKTAGFVTAAVKRQFGDEAGVQITDNDIIRWINEAQQEILSTNRVFKAKAVSNLVAGTYEYGFPTENMLDVQSIWVDGVKIDYMSFQDFEENILRTDPRREVKQAPTMWTEWAGSFVFWPTPDTDIANGITVFFTKGPTEVDAVGDLLSVPDTYVNRIIEFCTARAYELDEDYQASSMKLSQFTQGVSSLAEDETMPSVDTYPTITVLRDDQ
jgi:hypothetical protein